MTICWIKSEFVFLGEKVMDKLVFKIECALRKQTNPKQTLHCNSVCTFLRKEEINQSQTSISVCIPLAAHVCQLMKSVHGSPVIDFSEALICRLRSGSSLPLSLSLPFSSLSLLHHLFLSPMQAHTYTHLIVCYTVMPWAAYWALAAAVGKSCRANCLVQYLKSLDMINNVLRGAVSHQTAHHKHISPGNYRFTFSHTHLYLPFGTLESVLQHCEWMDFKRSKLQQHLYIGNNNNNNFIVWLGWLDESHTLKCVGLIKLFSYTLYQGACNKH